ncbi:hypothetical protein R1flu_023419 [Riccia fluitans]|uniref:Senescence domain-containing protein n=1 Tax=Riccia fluitans TaxID=41844 RepID=A0ABD1XS48_9MARC
MSWIKDKLSGKGSNGAPDQANFMVGSDRWLGNTSGQPSPVPPAGSFKNPEAANLAVQNAQSGQQNPYLYTEPLTPDSLNRAVESTSISTPGENKSVYPEIYGGPRSSGQEAEAVNASSSESSKSLYPEVFNPPGSDGEEVEVLTGEQVLVTVPGAIVHLIDQEESVHLASGEFQLIRYVQEKTKVVVIAKVGDELKWPLVQDMPTVKVDPTHYYFSLRVPKGLDSQPGEPVQSDGNQTQTLNYGVTFSPPSSEQETAMLQEVEMFLQRYSTFSAPTVVEKDAAQDVKDIDEAKLPPAEDPSFPGKVVAATTLSNDGQMVTEETSAAFWTTMAPNVDDYNSKAAKGIATGAGHVIRGILWLSETTVQQLDSGHEYMRSKFKPKKDPSKISPTTIANMRRVRKLTGMTDRVAKGVLGGIVYTTGLFSSAVINSPPGRAFFKLLPGEVALVSLDAFSRVFDAVEKGGKDVMSRSSEVTQDFVNYRYGHSAKDVTKESFSTVENVISTAWTLTKIRKALNPKRSKTSGKRGVLKAVAREVNANRNK